MAPKYRKVSPRIWNDKKFRPFSERAKLIFFFLLTHPHLTALGAMRATIPGLAAEYGLPEKAFREAFREALAKAMVKVDEEASFLVLPKFLEHNRPESPNVVKAWSDSLDLLPECALRNEHVQRVKAFAEGLGEAFREALPEAFAKAMPYQEQEQEQEQETNSVGSSPTVRVREEDFTRLWTAHPYGSKAEARKAYAAVAKDLKNPIPSELLTVLQRQIDERKQADRNGDFLAKLPHLCRWFKHRRWEDEPYRHQEPTKDQPRQRIFSVCTVCGEAGESFVHGKCAKHE